MDAEDVVRRAMKIAGDICVNTNHNVTLEKIDAITTTTATTSSATTTTSTTTTVESTDEKKKETDPK